MIYLVLAVIASVSVSTLLKLGNGHIRNDMTMFASNYLVCILFSALFVLLGGNYSFFSDGISARDIKYTFLLGAVSGVIYLLAFIIMQTNINKNGVVLTSTFMKLGVAVPVVMTIALGWEIPTAFQIAGCVLAAVAIIVSAGGGTTRNQRKDGMWLVILFFVGGLTECASKIFDRLGPSGLKNQFLFIIFATAFISSLAAIFIKRQNITLQDIGWGAMIGVPNYFASRFLLLSLSEVPAIVAFPVYCICGIMVISFIGLFVFREKLSRRKIVGIAIIIVATVLLNI